MSESSIVIYQVGSKAYNPKTNSHYDPWENHIWTCLEQARLWSPKTEIIVILDDDQVYGKENFERLNIKREKISDLKPRYDVDSIDHWKGDRDPLWRACLMRPFYIEEVMRKYNLKNTFSFDNDVLIYCDLDEIASKVKRLYNRTAMTAEHENALIFGMIYIKDHQSLGEINDRFWKMTLDKNDPGAAYDMQLWKRVQNELGDAYVNTLPIWVDGSLGQFHSFIGGIFDPISIGQYFGGCNNGNPAGTLFQHHYIARMFKTGKWRFMEVTDKLARRYFTVVDVETDIATKILSLHVHGKQLKTFKS